ncbi:MAG: NAD+ synthase [Alphaproteobacteria bacterium]
MAAPLSIVIAQINPVLGDLEGNRARIAEICQKHHEQAALIVFPELTICGYPPEDLTLKPSFVTACMEAVKALAKSTAALDCALLIGAPWWLDETAMALGDKPYNAALLLQNGKIAAIQYKYDLPNYDVFDEQRFFQSGALPKPITLNGHKIGVLICEDMWSAAPAQHLKDNGAELLIAINASPFTAQKYEKRLEIAKKRCLETALPLLYVNQIGGQDELVFDGGSFMLDASGTLIKQCPFFEELIAEAQKHKIDIQPPPSELERLYTAACLGLRDYVLKNGFSGVLLGLSGGIDSALVAVMAADALGAANVLSVMLPSPFTAQSSIDDAETLARNLGIALETYPISTTLESYEATIPALTGLAHENIQSRIRGTLLMALSNKSGKMLLTTGNKSEMATGYATIYGDMNGGYNPVKDIYKTDIYKLCEWRNSRGGGVSGGNGAPVIPQNILTKAPSAELRDNQTDQDSLPPYDTLDGILKLMIEGECSNAQIVALGRGKFTKDMVRHIRSLLNRAEYKRYQSAPGPKLTERAFGRNRRNPMTNHFADEA